MTRIPTEWDITHPCGHTVRRSFADKPAGERAGAARWWAKNRNCDACDAAARAAEHLVLLADAEHADLPALVGSEGAIRWAVRVRHQFLEAARRDLVGTQRMTTAEFAVEVLEAARRVTAAHWWVDNRGLPAEDLPELLADPGPAAVARRPAATSTQTSGTQGTETPDDPRWVSFFDQKAHR